MSLLLSNFTRKKFNDFFSYHNLTHYVCQSMLVMLIWATLWGIYGEEAQPPNGYLFNVVLLFSLAYLCGRLTTLFNIPKLVGALIIGFLLGNREYINISELNLNKNLSSNLRYIALVIIILRAGLELDPKRIYKLRHICLRLSFIPCIVEVVSIAVVSHLLLDFDWKWGFLLGFLLAAVSPAVIVPPILQLQSKGLGIDKGIPTLVFAAASIDDILAITGFGVCLKLIFIHIDIEIRIPYIVVKAIAEPLIGIMAGILIGLILWYIPSYKSSESQKLILLLFGGLSATSVLRKVHMTAAGLETCFFAAIFASLQWRSEGLSARIEKELKDIWAIFQPILFGLIGAEVRIKDLNGNWEQILWVFVTLIIGLSMRFIATILVTFGTDLNIKEKMFIGFVWLPKASFQAVAAPVILDMAQRSENEDNETYARKLIAIAFISILLTAPLGSIGISILGDKILEKTEKKKRLKA